MGAGQGIGNMGCYRVRGFCTVVSSHVGDSISSAGAYLCRGDHGDPGQIHPSHGRVHDPPRDPHDSPVTWAASMSVPLSEVVGY